MKFGNPTQIRLGQTGSFFNRTYRVIGRAVLGVVEGCQPYYWNEFYLESAGGGPATLVFEETETGSAWRLFTMFDPDPPMTATEAAAKKPSDHMHLDGAFFHVTRVDRSQVYYAEGKTPEGIRPGQVANYFNADAGSREIVVSWTGEEVEYYSGMTTSAPMVAAAFRLQGFAARRFVASGGRSWLSAQLWLPAVLGLALIGIPLGCFIDLSRARPIPAVRFVAAPVSTLRVGASGVLNEQAYTITGHELVEMAEMGWRRQGHHYDLRTADHNEAWLVCETISNAPVWMFYTSLQPSDPLTPPQAGGKLVGQKINVNGEAVTIQQLFRLTVHSVEGASDSSPGDVFYGFTCPMTANRVLLARWNQTNILYQQGAPVPARTVLAFGQPE